LAVVNSFTSPEIDQKPEEKIQNTMKEIMPEGENFTEYEYTAKLSDKITAVYKEDNGGYIFQIQTKGYKPGLIILCGIDKDGKIVGADYIPPSKETNEAEKGFGKNFIGQSLSSYEPEIISGSTKTTKAYSEAIKIALEAFEILTQKEDAQ